MKHGEKLPSANALKPPASKIEIQGDLQSLRDASLRLLIGLASAISLLILFAWLSEEVFEGDLQRFDLRIRAFVHSFSNSPLTRVMQTLSFLGSLGFLSGLFLIVIAIFLARKLRRPAIWFTVAAAGSVILDSILKLVFHRARPAAFFGTAPASYSFPSGHAMGSVCFYGVLAGLLSAQVHSPGARILIWVTSGVMIAGIGLSRIYLGVHYPTDVIAGYLAGGIWVNTLLIASRARPSASRTA
jgi:undecaprenyl-diphosphatase